MKTIFAVAFFSSVLLNPFISSATPVTYSLSGNVHDANNSVAVSGSMTVDDQWQPGGTPFGFYYQVTGYTVYAGSSVLSGDKGQLTFGHVFGPNPPSVEECLLHGGCNSIGSAVWSLSQGSNINSRWSGESLWFVKSDGTLVERTLDAYHQLTPKMEMGGPIFEFGGPVFPNLFPWPDSNPDYRYLDGEIVAVLADVPESPALLPFLFGFLCLILVMRRVQFA